MTRVPRSLLIAATFALTPLAAVAAQTPTPPASRPPAPTSATKALATAPPGDPAAKRDLISDAVRRLNWRSVGPANNAGRISVVAGIPGDPFTYYVAGANGGIIRTTNAGTTFKPIFDKQNISSIGAIAIAPSDPPFDLYWYGLFLDFSDHLGPKMSNMS